MRNVLKYAVAAFGVFAMTFVTSNVICDAATGGITYDGGSASYTVSGSVENYKIELTEK